MALRATLSAGGIAAAALAGVACSRSSDTDAPAPQREAIAAADTAVGQARQSRDSLSAAQEHAVDSAAGASIRPGSR